MWTNADLAPVPHDRRTWTAWNYVAYWIADCLNVNTWMIAGSLIATGMTWWQALISVAVGYGICAVVLVLNGISGAEYHVGFPVVCRSSFGLAGSFIPVLNRVIMACVWYGVQAWIGGECVYQMLRAIAPSIDNVPNTFPESSGTTSKAFIGFIVFWFVSLFAIWVPVDRIRHLFTVKSILLPIAAFSLFIWSIVRAHGLGPIISQPATFTSSDQAAWAIINGITGCMGNMAALIINTPDFTRYARKPSDIYYSQLVTMPVGFFITSFIGVVVTSSAQYMYGEAIWDPLQLLEKIDSRPAVFFIALAFALATLATNLCANSIPAGADMSALLPRYINIRRGGYICAVIGICITPWKLLSGASNFLNFLSAYAVFLGPICGVMVVDYFLVKRRHLVVEDLYRADGIYWYTWGINWRGYAGYIGGIAPNLPGFIGAMGYEVPIGATKLYSFAWILGFLVGGIIYYVCNLLFPCKWIIEERRKEVRYDVEDKPGATVDDPTRERRPSNSPSDWSVHDNEKSAEQNE
ncbi:NCS1 nucleoside transporter family [Umbelopsis sp. AD052]|nr:NCS1 nucleoside transporter family [Umbelopsis sp. AD052]